jgi:hypothetical protein
MIVRCQWHVSGGDAGLCCKVTSTRDAALRAYIYNDRIREDRRAKPGVHLEVRAVVDAA